MSLNAAQLDAVATLRGPLLVLAGAGTGKTSVVTHRIANLIKHRVSAPRILAVTFTNKAAREMQQRASALLGKRLRQPPEISTFHSLCVRILRRQIQHLGYPKSFVIFDRGDQESAARQALRESRVAGEQLRPADLLYFIGRWKTHAVLPEAAADEASGDKESLAALAYRRYQDALKLSAAVDFDDLLLLTGQLFREHSQVLRAESGRFDHLLVDEYQDTNASQYQIVRALAEPHRNLCVVGDDDQSIYGWRGADVEHILRFEHDWPDAKIIRLEDNYRSTEAILELANRLIACNLNRHPKSLRAARAGGERPTILQFQDETEEAAKIVADIQLRLQSTGTQPRHIAILFRTNEQPRSFEMELRRAKLPYVLVGGQSFYDRREVKDVLAYLRVLDNPHDEPSLLRIINTPPRGIGKAPITALVAEAVSSGRPLWDVLSQSDLPDSIAPAAAQAIRRFHDLIGSYQRRIGQGSLVDAATNLIAEIGYQQELARQFPEADEQEARWGSVRQVIDSLGGYEQRAKKPTLRGFLDEMALGEREDAEDKESQLSRNAIALLTLHAAKGLEFPHVYLVGLEEGLLPHQKSVDAERHGDATAIDEERRLAYVGVTRARDTLTMSLALSRMRWGKPRPTEPSRFLYELTGRTEAREKRLAAKTSGKPKSPRPRRRTRT